MPQPLTTFIDYLEKIGGSEKFEFWVMKDGKVTLDERGNPIPDPSAAHAYCSKLREQHPELRISYSTNIVRVALPTKVRTA